MKSIKFYQLLGYVILFLLIMTSCEEQQDIEGNGIVTTEFRPVTTFSELSVDGVLNVYFKQADVHEVRVKTDDNLHTLVMVEQLGDMLKVFTDTDAEFEATELDVFITAPYVNNFVLDGVTALYVTEVITLDHLSVHKKNTGYMHMQAVVDRFDLISDGVGDIDLEGKTMTATVDNVMIGNIHAYNFKADKMFLTHNGTGTIEINVISDLQVEIFGVGDVYCKGAPENVERSGNGIGSLHVIH
jgi:hypothetical protein